MTSISLNMNLLTQMLGRHFNTLTSAKWITQKQYKSAVPRQRRNLNGSSVCGKCNDLTIMKTKVMVMKILARPTTFWSAAMAMVMAVAV